MNLRPCLRRLPLLFLVAVAGPLPADEVRLHDGRVLVGSVTRKGDTLEIDTRDGLVVVAESQVATHRTEEMLRLDLAGMARNALASSAGNTRFTHLNLAAQAQAYGLAPEMWRHLDQAVQPDANETSDALERRVADFLARLEPELLPRKFRHSPTALRVQKVLEGLRPDTSAGRAAASEELLVREANADQALRQEARRNPTPRRRIGALAALQRRELAGNDRFVLRTAFLDGNAEVRRTAIEIGRAAADADDVAYLANGLQHPNAKVRERTAEAFGELGHPDAVKMLVLAAPHAGLGLVADGGGDRGVRGHIAILQQQAYIRDFDVEVAQAAFIADPKVDVLQSGSVLDVTVAGVVEERIILRSYRFALKKLTQQDPGADARRWANWYTNLQSPVAPPTTGRR